MSQMNDLFPGVDIHPGGTAKYNNYMRYLASNLESFDSLITRVLAYANALLQNGYEIVNINLVSARNVNTENSYYVGSKTTGEIIFKEYRSAGGTSRIPVHAKWWESKTNSDMDKIGNRKVAFRNTPDKVMVDESSTSFTTFIDRFIGKEIISSTINAVLGNPRNRIGSVTQDSVYSVLWYCDRTDSTKASIRKSNK